MDTNDFEGKSKGNVAERSDHANKMHSVGSEWRTVDKSAAKMKPTAGSVAEKITTVQMYTEWITVSRSNHLFVVLWTEITN